MFIFPKDWVCQKSWGYSRPSHYTFSPPYDFYGPIHVVLLTFENWYFTKIKHGYKSVLFKTDVTEISLAISTAVAAWFTSPYSITRQTIFRACTVSVPQSDRNIYLIPPISKKLPFNSQKESFNQLTSGFSKISRYWNLASS